MRRKKLIRQILREGLNLPKRQPIPVVPELNENLTVFLQDMAQMVGGFDYGDIYRFEETLTPDRLKKLKALYNDVYDAMDEYDDVAELYYTTEYRELIQLIKGEPMNEGLNIVNDLILESNIIQLPYDEIRQVTKTVLIPFIQKKIIPELTDDIRVPRQNAYAPEAMHEIYKGIPGYDNRVYNLSAAFYYDKQDEASARMAITRQTILINMARANIADLNTIIIHELTHQIDPKLNKPDVNAKIHQKYGERNSERVGAFNDEKAQKAAEEEKWVRRNLDPREYDAHSGEIIRTLQTNVNSLPHKQRSEYSKMIWNIIIDIKKNDIRVVYKKYYHEPVKFLFTDDWWEFQTGGNIIDTNFHHWLTIMKVWSGNDKLYRKFYSRLNKYVPYS